MGCKRGCPERFREAAREAGWELHEDGWWKHPTISVYVEPWFRDEDVDEHTTKLTMQRPSIRAKAVGLVAKKGLEKFDDFMSRMGLK
jgi:hypothetical protein